VDEHAERMWLPQRHAEAIKAMVGRHQLNGQRPMRGQPRLSWKSDAELQPRALTLANLQRIVAGADVFSRQSEGTTIAAQYAKHGISLRCASTDRVNGWAEVMEGLGAPNDGQRATLFIHERCKRLVETLPALQHDPNRPEDVLKVDADDGVEAVEGAASLAEPVSFFHVAFQAKATRVRWVKANCRRVETSEKRWEQAALFSI
jgi:hypothetical protein